MRWAYVQANAFELFTAILAIVASLTYFYQPQNLSDSSVGHIRFPDVLWNGLYGVGAILVALGIVRLDVRVEAIGLSLFAAAVTIDAAAVYHYRGWPASSTIAIFVAFGVASVIRLHTLFTGSK